MDLALSEEQQMIVDMTRAVLEEHCAIDVVREIEDDPTGYPEPLFKQMTESGLNGLIHPSVDHAQWKTTGKMRPVMTEEKIRYAGSCERSAIAPDTIVVAAAANVNWKKTPAHSLPVVRGTSSVICGADSGRHRQRKRVAVCVCVRW